MTRQTPLSTSTPFWGLLAISVVLTVTGLWVVLDKISILEGALVNGASTTGVEVYGGQAWVTLGAALTTAGLIGVVATLAIASVRPFAAPRPTEAALTAEQPLAAAPAFTPALFAAAPTEPPTPAHDSGAESPESAAHDAQTDATSDSDTNNTSERDTNGPA